MNDNIQKLYENASLVDSPTGTRYSLPDEFVEKFAELIVLECAKVCDDLDIDDWGDKSFDDGTYYCSRAIKQHFGVEE